MKKTIMFESVKYGDENNGKLRIDLELRETDKGEVFSASGDFYGKHIMGGQILDENFIFKTKKDNDLFLEIKRLWEQYHLNDMRADCGCGINEALADKKIKVYEYRCNFHHRRIEELIEILEKNSNFKDKVDFKHVKKLLAIGWEFESTLPWYKLPRYLRKHYTVFKVTEKLAGQVRCSKLCPDGVLCRICPKCGKRYGRSWYFKTIPAGEVKKIKLIMDKKD